jgi:ABC-type multidrug transport system permease subunit
MLAFLREPEALFWVFAFPIVMALALGLAYRNQGPQRSVIGVQQGAGADSVLAALARSPDLTASVLDSSAAELALRQGKIAVLVRPRPAGAPVLVFDPARPETRLAHLATVDALERAGGRTDVVRPESDTRERRGGRYIDFLLPGLIGLNLLGTGMWGIGFPVANARQLKLLKRMIATPMRRTDYLVSLMLARLVWLVLEVVALLLVGWLVFHVTVSGSWLAFALVTLVGAAAFSALGLLVASRAKTIEAVSGLMNVAMIPMWLLSGTFFSAERFPPAMQPFIQALPLTATNDALRAIMNEGAGLGAVVGDLGMLAAWGVGSFAVALALFRWE